MTDGAKVVLSERMQVTWPIVLAIGAATWWVSGTLTDIRYQMTRLVEITTSHESRLYHIEGVTSSRGARIDAIESSLRAK